MLDLLKKHFGYEQFRPLQGEIVNHCVSGQDALVLMPTGGGKSLCYQLPALKFPGLTVVISPLIALMKDQVDALRANGIPAAFLNSTLNAQEAAKIELQARRGELKLLYLAPERVAMPSTQQFLGMLQISLFAVDEAHCISEWGHDFRPEYRGLSILRRLFPYTPMIALTATANPRVKEDIVKQLALEKGKIFQSSFNRHNLTYRVVPKKKALDRLLHELKARDGESAIVYCFSRKGTEKVAADLKANGINAAAYHAGLTHAERTRVQERFIRDQVPVIAATIAFGMGIDKPDVRLVVHMDLPKSVEGYYQETGRAGRDGLPSDCLLFYSAGDKFKHEFFIRDMQDPKEQLRTRLQLQEMVRYCEHLACRRKFLMEYFGEKWTEDKCGSCDICAPQAEPVMKGKRGETVGDFDQELFDRLRAIRRSLAEARGVPPYVVFGDKTLQEMSRYFPQKMESLGRIFGVGKEKLSQYGERFLEDIRAYAKQKGIGEKMPDVASAPARVAPARRALSGTMATTLQLFQEKKSVEEIARFRNLAVGTVLSHLEEGMERGVAVDASHLSFPSPERFVRIAEAFQKSQSDLLSPAKSRLGDDYGYDEIRLARFLLKAQKRLS